MSSSVFIPLVSINQRARSVKRGATGPAPSRENRLWDGKAARKGTLEVRCAHTNELLSSKEAAQEQLALYAAKVVTKRIETALSYGLNVEKAKGRRWMKRLAQGKREEWVKRVDKARGQYV